MPTGASSRHVLLVVAATACWGGGTVLSKLALDRGIAPLTLLAIELGASCLLLGVSAVVRRSRPRPSQTLARLALLGVLNPGIAYALGLLGLASITASTSVLLWATEPVFIMVLAVLVLRERVAAATMTAVAIALVGVLLVIHRPGAGGDATGIVLTLAAVSACAFYTVLTRRLVLDDSSLDVVLVQQAAALCFALVLTTTGRVLGITAPGAPPDLAAWGLAAASGTVYYGLAFWFYVGGLRGVPASTAGALYPLIPVFGLAAAHLAGDRLTGWQWVGAGIVVVAVGAAAAQHLVGHRASPRPAPHGSCRPPAPRGRRRCRRSRPRARARTRRPSRRAPSGRRRWS